MSNETGDSLQVQGADGILAEAMHCIGQRAADRDTPGERSMAKTVAAFNALTGRGLTEREGWVFMAVLKLGRAQVGSGNRDHYVDLAAYAALAGECAAATTPLPGSLDALLIERAGPHG